ncbi:hypothetical protein [Acaryochloris sp. CCMEE 5410]|uniref:hypothetical protein n=1 Tax=Acaryochloris sp. CCMEE 5410 TaxID=310037 RepID=UPI00024837BC|nr:hypothetical protein [Acaryochloris sp. CCMEE 5410]KAI9129615.1 hypothetical protein ON05_033500 [Acaryochloris sp. CCMEE 5410]
MPKPHNPYPTSPLPWCDPPNQEAMTQAILENTTTQLQFYPYRPAEDSDGCAEDKTTEGFR